MADLADLLEAAALEARRLRGPGVARAVDSEDERIRRGLHRSWQRFVQIVDQIESVNPIVLTHSEIARRICVHKTTFSNLYKHGFTLRNQVSLRQYDALEELLLDVQCSAVRTGSHG